MKYILQFIIVMAFYQVGNLISTLIKPWLVIPGSIIGMLLLFIALMMRLIKIEHIEATSSFFLKHMGFFFIPLGVSLLESYILLKTVAWQLMAILIMTNILVMGITAKVTDFVIEKGEHS